MKLAIMQPYFFPYIGYFQLIKAVDKFVVYDNIEFTKKGWIHRNRILVNGKDAYISVMLKKDSDYLHVKERVLSEEFEKEKDRIMRRIEGTYKKAPFFSETISLIREITGYNDRNLFNYIYHSIKQLRNHLDIDTELIISSEIAINHDLKGREKVIGICKELDATHYINPIGGIELYNKKEFSENGIELSFLKTREINYKQLDNEFIPWLSVIDVLMFNGKEKTKKLLDEYDLA
ncbi:WbqC family protein [Agriterribacter sp.]|uniref:WbqC family protein n=1 Tax=Agriterribacter sp. TaxID=2821509 RepID=UPI002B90F1F4|nr:WbqC family protein [Agriterribacter sp.]HRP58356.1 WbqC family protein [Agriterribacter sp.]